METNTFQVLLSMSDTAMQGNQDMQKRVLLDTRIIARETQDVGMKQKPV